MTKLVIFWDPIADFAAADYTDSADAMDIDAEASDADAAEMWKTGRLRNRWWGQLPPPPTYLPSVSTLWATIHPVGRN